MLSSVRLTLRQAQGERIFIGAHRHDSTKNVILKTQGVPEGSGGMGETAHQIASAFGGITALIRHLLRKCHLPPREG